MTHLLKVINLDECLFRGQPCHENTPEDQMCEPCRQHAAHEAEFPKCPICQEPIDYCQGHGVANTVKTCGICGERFTGSHDEEIGEFYDHESMRNGLDSKYDSSIIAHAQCGIDAEMELA